MYPLKEPHATHGITINLLHAKVTVQSLGEETYGSSLGKGGGSKPSTLKTTTRAKKSGPVEIRPTGPVAMFVWRLSNMKPKVNWGVSEYLMLRTTRLFYLDARYVIALNVDWYNLIFTFNFLFSVHLSWEREKKMARAVLVLNILSKSESGSKEESDYLKWVKQNRKEVRSKLAEIFVTVR